MDSRCWVLDGCDGSLVNLVNMDNLVKWLNGPAPISRELSLIGAGSALRYEAIWL